MAFANNTSFHPTIKTSPFDITFGTHPRTQLFQTPEVWAHYGEDKHWCLQTDEHNPGSQQAGEHACGSRLQKNVVTKIWRSILVILSLFRPKWDLFNVSGRRIMRGWTSSDERIPQWRRSYKVCIFTGRSITKKQHQLSSFPNLRSCLYNNTCHSFPNLKICLITTLLLQNTHSSCNFKTIDVTCNRPSLEPP